MYQNGREKFLRQVFTNRPSLAYFSIANPQIAPPGIPQLRVTQENSPESELRLALTTIVLVRIGQVLLHQGATSKSLWLNTTKLPWAHRRVLLKLDLRLWDPW